MCIFMITYRSILTLYNYNFIFMFPIQGGVCQKILLIFIHALKS